MHFTRHSMFEDREAGGLGHSVPIITRGEGWTIWDDRGNEYIDGLAGLFVNNVGHGRTEIGEAMAKQASELAFFPLWSYAHPRAIELAERLAHNAPGDLNRVFFTTGGGEAVETAWKLAKQYFKLTGKPTKHKVISRAVAYHGTPQGALSITGIPAAKVDFEPLVPGGHKVPNTNMYRAPEHLRDDEKAFGRWAADRIAEAIEFEGPDSVAAVFLEPVQNSGGCFPPPAGYFERVREICDEYDVLLVSDETICAFGRIGSMFACQDFGYQPDIITTRQGHDERLRPARPDDRERPALRAVPPRHDVLPARLHLGRAPGLLRRGDGQPRHLRPRGPQRPGQGERPGLQGDPRQAARPAARR